MSARSPGLALSALVALVALGCVSCGEDEAPARPQWLVEVTTDALEPVTDPSHPPTSPVTLIGDRLLVEVLREDGTLACPSCRREAVCPTRDDWPATFGIEATSDGVLVRARLYRSDHIGSDGQPNPATTIDMMGRLPAIGDGVVGVGIRLELSCMGRRSTGGSTLTCVDGEADQQPPILTGPRGTNGDVSPLFAQIARDCPQPDAVDDGMACVPGGMFFLGDPLAPVPHSDVAAAAIPEQVFGVDAFLLDRDEITVAQLDQFMNAKPVAKGADGCATDKLLFCRSPQDAPTSQKYFCTYEIPDPITLAPPANPPQTDRRAANCISKQLAEDFCAYQGKRLPTEIEWEFAAANGMRETRFPWDNRPPDCELAWLSRGASTAAGNAYVQCADTTSGDDTATSAGGVASPDQVPMAGDGKPADRAKPWAEGPDDKALIFSLAGNVSEWTSDFFWAYGSKDEPACWSATEPVMFLSSRLADGAWCKPVEDPAIKYREYSVRGGNWREPLDSAWSANRAHATHPSIVPRPDIGFRCARSLP